MMRLIILLLLSIVIGVFVWQNLPSVTLIFFGGSMIARLPLAIWIVIFTGAGLVGSLIIQLLSNLFRPNRAKVEPFKPSPAPRPKKTVDPKRKETAFRSSSSVYDTPATDWNNSRTSFRDEIDDWDIESPPTEQTPIRDYRQERITERESVKNTEPSIVPDFLEDPLQDREIAPEPQPNPPPVREERKIDEEELINYEVPQSPQNVSRSGSIYSYTYRESAKAQPKPPERVYDADFRVINPPDKENTDPIEPEAKTGNDEEEWI